MTSIGLFSKVSAQSMATTALSGMVVDINDSALDGVEISYNGEAIKTKSDGLFEWQLKANQDAKIQLQFSKLGYKTQTISIKTKKKSGYCKM